MKKWLLVFLISFNCFSAAWKPFSELLSNAQVLKAGDIIVLKKVDNSLTSIFGHIAFVNKDLKVNDFKLYGIGFSEAPIYTLASSDRLCKVLRYKYMDNKLLDVMENELNNWTYKMYDIFIPIEGDKKYTYCSQFIYQLFLDSGKKLNRNIVIANISNSIVEPYDFLGNKDLEEINF